MTAPKKDFEQTKKRMTPAKLDEDMKYICALLKETWLEKNNKNAKELSADDKREISAFTQSHQGTALRAMQTFEEEYGEPMKRADYQAQDKYVTACIQKALQTNKPSGPKR